MMFTDLPFLSLAIWFPILSGVVLLFSDTNKNNFFGISIKKIAFFLAFISFILSLLPVLFFNKLENGFQFVEKFIWFKNLNVYYFLGVDGISIFFLPLTGLITLIVICSAWDVIKTKIGLYMGNFLILSGLLIGVFCALDGLLFYVFFEATLLPMYLIIGIWGGPKKVYAAFKFFLYTLLGSLLALVSIVYLYLEANSFSLQDWYVLPLDLRSQILIFLSFFLAFAVKIPMWPVHTWLPDAHVEAPTGGSIVLAAIMLKLGGYGFLRLSLPIAPDAAQFLAPLIIGLSLIAISYIGLVALIQTDMKRLIAYSSVAHMGFVTLGIFLFTSLGVHGGIFQMISHGFISGALFFCIGVLYDRLHSREISDYGGVVSKMPIFSAFFVFFAMANCGLPSTSGFVGEFFVIISALEKNFIIGILSALTLVIGAAYSLFLVKKIIFGKIVNVDVSSLKDINFREFSLLFIFLVFVLVFGIKPDLLTNYMSLSIEKLLLHVGEGKVLQVSAFINNYSFLSNS